MQLTIYDQGRQPYTVNLEEFHKDTISFGRHPESDIIMHSDFVSRIHGCIYQENGQWYIEDVGSTYGLYCDGQRIKRKHLRNGVQLEIPYGGQKVKLICSETQLDGQADRSGSSDAENGSSNVGGNVEKASKAGKVAVGTAHSSRTIVIICSAACACLLAVLVVLIVVGVRRQKIEDKATESKMASEEISEEEQTTVSETTETTEITETTETTETTTEATTTEDSEQKALEEAKEIYADIINTYHMIAENGLEYQDIYGLDFPYESIAESYSYSIQAGGSSLDEIGYKIFDEDGDGVMELMLARIGSSYIYDLYTIRDSQPIQVAISGERCGLCYCGDSYLYNGSDGAAYYTEMKFTIANGDIQYIQVLYTEPLNNDPTSDVDCYYSSTDYDHTSYDDTEISYEEFSALIEEWHNEECNIPDLIPLSQYY